MNEKDTFPVCFRVATELYNSGKFILMIFSDTVMMSINIADKSIKLLKDGVTVNEYSMERMNIGQCFSLIDRISRDAYIMELSRMLAGIPSSGE